jgi:hypothetical protein
VVWKVQLGVVVDDHNWASTRHNDATLKTTRVMVVVVLQDDVGVTDKCGGLLQ